MKKIAILIIIALCFSCKKNDSIYPNDNGTILIDSILVNDIFVPNNGKINNVNFNKVDLQIRFNTSVDTSQFNKEKLLFSSGIDTFYTHKFNENSKVLYISPYKTIKPISTYQFFVDLGKNFGGLISNGYSISFRTCLDSTYKFSIITDETLLTLIQQQTFKYFYDYAHPLCGMARERKGSGDIVTTGGSGFGVMALIVGMERNFITRSDGINQLDKILHFLETCDRFHGAWPHWLNGITGKTVPFSPNDDGGDLVETSFMIQGLITMRQYLNPSDSNESDLINRINLLCSTVEYDWFTNGGQNSLFWHWSPTTGWLMNFRLEGYNETLITYVVAATSITHPIPAIAYHEGYARNGAIKNGNSYYGLKLPLGEPYGGPLFFSQYSYLGLDPRNLIDVYANLWEQNVNHSLINQAYCKANPKKYVGYSDQCWGLTASDNQNGYSAHSPTNDLGVISPTAAISSIPYTPEQSLQAIRFFYYILGDKLWGDYGFYDAFNLNTGWWANSYLAIDQGPQIIMIENYRSGLCWNLFMSAPEVQPAMTKLGFSN